MYSCWERSISIKLAHSRTQLTLNMLLTYIHVWTLPVSSGENSEFAHSSYSQALQFQLASSTKYPPLWVGRDSMEWELCPTCLHMTSMAVGRLQNQLRRSDEKWQKWPRLDGFQRTYPKSAKYIGQGNCLICLSVATVITSSGKSNPDQFDLKPNAPSQVTCFICEPTSVRCHSSNASNAVVNYSLRGRHLKN